MTNDNQSFYRKAVALSYDSETDNAPRVVALGKGIIAEKIISIAEEYGITVHKDKELVDKLLKLQLGEEVPPEFYRVIAEIFSFIFTLEDGLKDKTD
ncbi:MAG TPA: hypothetical protein GXX38_01350 [Clostridia bacterium]|nr:hypothetical protein [Clostridia bacterium]